MTSKLQRIARGELPFFELSPPIDIEAGFYFDLGYEFAFDVCLRFNCPFTFHGWGNSKDDCFFHPNNPFL